MKKRTDNFDKFANQKKGSAIKEAFRQEKKKIKAEARAAGEEMRKKKIEKMRGEQEKATSFKPQATSKGKGGKAAGFEPRAASKGAGGAYKKKNNQPEPQADNIALQGKGADEQMPLNKFIAHAGVCGRREAAELVKDGKVTVNGDKVFEPGYKVSSKDKVIVKGKQVFLQRNAVYILLNKPKDYITTANDPQGRKTVLDLIKNATPERVYPVGRLDRNTTGVLILTNDGELAQKLTHPSFEVKKIYEVTLDKPVIKKDLEAILSGVTLEDGFVQADSVGYADDKQKNIVGIEIHSGRNRIVRRIFEHLGYDVKGLDRVMFANLTKKNVDRGKWRFLNEKEVRLLKFMNKSFVRKTK
jgi:23S rRNA pseudouridine2605 synthase